MQIDRHNFPEHFFQISDHLHKASFVSFDCQFTGLVTNQQKIQGLFPNHRQFYERIKQTALNFKIIQLGLTAFIYNQSQQAYEPHTYNFYTLPFVNVPEFNNVMIAEVESLQFLAKHGMNWNRVLQNGIIPQRLVKPFTYLRHNYDDSKSSFDKEYFFGGQDQNLVETIQQILRKLGQEKSTQKIDFEKTSIFSYFTQKYNNQLIIKKDKKTIKKYQYQVQFLKGQQNIIFEKSEQKLNTYFNQQEQQKNKYSIQQLLSIIVKKQLPIIGYFPNLDLGLIYHTYFDDLPQKFEQFCGSLHKLFPKIYDVKVLSKPVQARFKGLKASIKSLYEACFDAKTLAPYANIFVTNSQKQMQNSQSHEAGYDAYITGCAFIGMVNLITNNDKRKQLNFQQFQKLTGMTNIVYSKHTGDILLQQPYCKKSFINARKIVIGKFNKSNQIWRQIANKLTKYGSLCVYQDHNQTYFVYEEQLNNIEEIIKELKQKYEIVHYNQRKIAKARDMYKRSSQQLYFNK